MELEAGAAPGRSRTLRGARGDRAERLAAAYLERLGWKVVATQVRVGRDEIDLVCVEPTAPPTLVFVEVRSRTSGRFGAPEESVTDAKVLRTYRAAFGVLRAGRLPEGQTIRAGEWRVDLIAVDARAGYSSRARGPSVRHVRGIAPS